MCDCNEVRQCLVEEGFLIGGAIDERFSLYNKNGGVG